RSVLGSREGFEKPAVPPQVGDGKPSARRNFEVIDGGPDRDITDNVAEDSKAAKELAAMKSVEPSFRVGEFLQGARSAYEITLMAFERGDLAQIEGFLSPPIRDAFNEVIESRKRQGLTIQASFVGIRELGLADAEFNRTTGIGEITVRFIGELTS